MRDIIIQSENYKPPRRTGLWESVPIPEHVAQHLKHRFWVALEWSKCRALVALIDNAFAAGASNDLLLLTSAATFKRLGPDETQQYVRLLQQHPEMVAKYFAEGAANVCVTSRPPEIPVPASELKWDRNGPPLDAEPVDAEPVEG